MKKQRRKYRLKKRRNTTLEEYNRMYQEQNGTCAICGKEETARINDILCHLSIDHNHITGKVRGLLCKKCNSGIGFLDGDSGIDLLLKATAYLQERN